MSLYLQILPKHTHTQFACFVLAFAEVSLQVHHCCIQRIADLDPFVALFKCLFVALEIV